MSSIITQGSASGTGSMTLAAPVTNSNQTATLPDATGTVMVSGNMPAFSAYGNTNQSVSSSTWTKVQLNAKNFDTANAFDATTNYRFQPLVAGYYQFSGNSGNYSTSSALVVAQTALYKNGAAVYVTAINTSATTQCNTPVSGLIYLNGSTDYVELYGYVNASSGALFATNSFTTMYMTGVLVRAA